MNWQQWDAFVKVEDAFVRRTQSGAFVSILITALLLLLAASETILFLSPHYVYQFTVDPNVRMNVDVNVDVTVAMKCEFVTMNAFDVSGTSLYIDNQIERIPTTFSTEGVYLHGKRPRYASSDSPSLPHFESPHQPIQSSPGQPVDLYVSNACRMRGSFSINKVAGNVHITALGHAYAGFHVPHHSLNFTHRVDKFTFGKDVSRDQVVLSNPLSYSYEVSNTNFEMYQYFLSVVPTTYVSDFTTTSTNQYAVTDHKGIINPDNPAASKSYVIPGIFFRYNFEPIAIQITEERSEPLSRFLVRMAGILGGVYVSAGIFHSLGHFVWRTLQDGRKRSVRI